MRYVGSAPAAPPAPLYLDLYAAPHGGWTPTMYPHGIVGGGKLIWGGINGDSGNVEVMSYDLSSSATSFINLHSALSGLYGAPEDNHAAPAILARNSDGTLMVFYCTQGDTVMRLTQSVGAYDISNWGSEQHLSLGGSNYLYPAVCQLSGEADHIYLFWKDSPGSTTYLRQAVSVDDAATWGSTGRLFASSNGFHTIGSNDVDRVDYFVTNVAPGGGANNGIYHFYQRVGSLYKSDGTLITTAIPITTSDCTTVYASGSHDVFPYAVSYDGSGHPVVVCAEFGATVQYFEERWTGSAWARHNIATTAAMYFGTQPPGIVNDSADPNRVFLGKDSGSDWTICEYTSADAGVTWSLNRTLVTDSAMQGGPAAIKFYGVGEPAVIWMNGPFVTNYDYRVASRGAI